MPVKKINKQIMHCRTNEDGDSAAYIFLSGFPGQVIIVYEDAYGELETRRVTCQQALSILGADIDDEAREFLKENSRQYYENAPKYQS